MLTVLAFCQKDQSQAERLAHWIAELGGCKGHELLLGDDSAVYSSDFERILKLFTPSFDKVQTVPIANPYNTDENAWPRAANFAFSTLARHIGEYKLAPYFVWIEPDSVPLSAGWLDVIAIAHIESRKQFTGVFVRGVNGSVDHMSGLGVYPGNMVQYAGIALISDEVPWDIAAAFQIVPLANFTRLIHHSWKGLGFSSLKELRELIGPEPVLYHSAKTSKLIDLLRTEKNLPAPVLAEKEAMPVNTGTNTSDEARESTENCDHTGEGSSMVDSRGGQNLLVEPEFRQDNVIQVPVPTEGITKRPGEVEIPFTFARYVAENGKWRPVPVPWANKKESLAYIDSLALELKKFCTAPRSTLVVRERLRKIRVITKVR